MCFGSYPMRRSRIPIWMLLTYLVLFLNFGPSWHRADIFGLHNEPAAHQDVACVHVCSCQHHFADASQSSDATVTSNHECAFCKFFDQYTVVLHSFNFSHVEEPVHVSRIEIVQNSVSCPVRTVARGPPVA